MAALESKDLRDTSFSQRHALSVSFSSCSTPPSTPNDHRSIRWVQTAWCYRSGSDQQHLRNINVGIKQTGVYFADRSLTRPLPALRVNPLSAHRPSSFFSPPFQSGVRNDFSVETQCLHTKVVATHMRASQTSQLQRSTVCSQSFVQNMTGSRAPGRPGRPPTISPSSTRISGLAAGRGR